MEMENLRKIKLTITPEMAKQMLLRNYPKNRALRRSTVMQYMTDIIEGRWNERISAVDQPIAFSNTGLLINGQHRLRAIIQAGTAVNVWCVYDVPEELYDYFDGGIPRKVSDIIDVPNATGAAALGRVMYAVKYGQAPLSACLNGYTKGGHPPIAVTKQQTISIVNEDKDAVNRYINLGQRARKYMGHNPNNLAMAFFIIDFLGRGDQLERFVDECSKMVPTSSPIIACRSYMGNCMANKNFKTDRKWFVSCVFTAYEAFRNERPLMQFNKAGVIFSKYDKYLGDARENNEKENNYGASRL